MRPNNPLSAAAVCLLMYDRLDYSKNNFYLMYHVHLLAETIKCRPLFGPVFRGVQYVHCVMHKCIMVKLGGNEKHIKFFKITKMYEIREGNLQK